MSEAGTLTGSPFLIKKISNRLDINEVKVSAQAIKKRKIHLLEWALLAPLSELDEPKPTLKEIGTEFGIEKVEFLEHVANNLTGLGVLSQNNGDTYDITEMGQKLYRKGEMVSDPQNISIPIYYEPHSKEWVVGAKNIDAREFVNRHEDTVYDIDKTSITIPDKLINKHVKALKLLEKGQSIENHSIEEVNTKITDVELKIFLNKKGLDFHITKNPFGEEYNDLLKKILKEQLFTKGGLKQYLDEYEKAASKYSNLPVKQCYDLDGTRLYSLAEKNQIINELLTSRPKWMINSNMSSVNHIRKSKIKPDIMVHLNNNSKFEIQATYHNSLIIPNSIELFVPVTKINIGTDSIISNNKVAIVSLIEASGYKIPLYCLEKTKDASIFENEIYNLFSISKGNSSEKLAIAIGKFMLRPDESHFNDILVSLNTNSIKDKKSSKNALKEIEELRGRLSSFNNIIISNAPVYKAILDNLDLNDLIELDISTILHCRELYLQRLKKTTEKGTKIKDSTWSSIYERILLNKDSYQHVKELKNKLTSENNQYSGDILEEIEHILAIFEQNVDGYIGMLPRPSKKKEVEEIYEAIGAFNPSIKQNYLKIIYDGLEEQIDNFESNELFEIYKFLHKHGYKPKEITLSTLANKKFKAVNWDLLDPMFPKEIKSIKSDFKVFDNVFNIDSLIKGNFPSNVEMVSDKNQIQTLFNNLISLRKTGIITVPDIKNILEQEFNLLKNSNDLEKTPIGLFLLANMKRQFGNDKLLDMSLDDIWDYAYPYLSSNTNSWKKIEGDLKFLGLKEQLQQFEKQLKNEQSNSAIENKDHGTQLVLDMPPIKRIIIDGSNVARQDHKNGEGSIKQLLKAYDDLVNKYGFEDVRIIVGAGLRHKAPDFDKLNPYIDKKIALQAPAGVSDDEFIIKKAIEKDLLIMTNDMYREFRSLDQKYENEIQRRRTAYMIDPDTGSFTLQFPNYEEGN
ncbi:hypothetical protein V7O61_07510 [Methanolobus sp. WCC1]|uniref:NYN domain-containing protein n=1 Tax=unclassified Methanolobus TaxID=2629569 RepID=UPI0025901BCB|nr:hypothetical protein [Methanolobus sp.]